MSSFCVIGSGISGATIANLLNKKHNVDLYDKARGLGGRSSFKRLDKIRGFDHGTQYFSPKTTEFKRFTKKLIEKKILKIWEGNHKFLSDKNINILNEILYNLPLYKDLETKYINLKKEYDEKHIDGAMFWDMDEHSDKDSPYPHMMVNSDYWTRMLWSFGIQNNDHIVVYDFSDVYSTQRIPEDLKKDEVLWGECLSGALYWNDFLNLSLIHI